MVMEMEMMSNPNLVCRMMVVMSNPKKYDVDGNGKTYYCTGGIEMCQAQSWNLANFEEKTLVHHLEVIYP